MMYQSFYDTLWGQLTDAAAEVYEDFFLPALFQQWAAPVAEAARLTPGQQVLDVACGTGVLAREVASRVGPGGTVIGLDRNDGMLSVARDRRPDLEWHEGMAESLPFPDQSFDAVVSQFGLMFFDDRTAALREMWRVLRPGGRLVVAVWNALEEVPGYAVLVDLLEELFGAQAANEMRGPFVLGDRKALVDLFADAGISDVTVDTTASDARYASIEAWMHTDVKGWTLGEVIDDAGYERLLSAAADRLARFVSDDGSVAFPHPAHIVTATKD